MPKCFKCGEPSNVSRDGVYFCDFHNRKQDEEEKKRLNRFKFLNSIIDNTYKIVIIIIVLISILVVLSLILPLSSDILFLSNDSLGCSKDQGLCYESIPARIISVEIIEDVDTQSI